jgi:predicted DNA-binding transcriptional regulator YafY
MAKKRSSRPPAAAHAVTAERAARLFQLLTLLGGGPQTRDALRRTLRMDVRSFYRDLELLRASGIAVPLRERCYVLQTPARTACAMLPFPDPHLTLGDAVELARGRGAGHRKLKAIVDQIVKKKAKKK